MKDEFTSILPVRLRARASWAEMRASSGDASDSGDAGDEAYHLYFEHRDEYVFARVVAAEMSLGVAKDVFGEISRTVRFSRTGRLLIDNQIVVLPPDDEIFEIADHVVELMPGVKIAFVDDDIRLREFMRFAAAVGSQAGEDHKYFRDEDEAESWLLCSDDPQMAIHTSIHTSNVPPSKEERRQTLDRRRLAAQDLVEHLERIRPSIAHDENALDGWRSRHSAAEKALKKRAG